LAFVTGVERAIDLAYAARRAYPDQRIFLLGEIIPQSRGERSDQTDGIVTIAGKPGDKEINQLGPDDIVIIPAFGTEVATRRKLKRRFVIWSTTTCGDVMSVWKRVRQYSKDSVTSIIHGRRGMRKRWPPVRRPAPAAKGHYLVVFTLAETDYVCNYIIHGGNKTEFLRQV